MDSLPPDVVGLILAQIDCASDWAALAQTCRRVHRVASSRLHCDRAMDRFAREKSWIITDPRTEKSYYLLFEVGTLVEGYVLPNGQKHGPCRFTSRDVFRCLHYYRGLVHGLCESWHPGDEIIQEKFVAGHPKWERLIMRGGSSGLVMMENSLVAGLLHGIRRMSGHHLIGGQCLACLREPQIHSECQYCRGERHGEERIYSHEGALIRINTWHRGQLLSSRAIK